MKKYFCTFTLLFSTATLWCMNSLSPSQNNTNALSLTQLRNYLQNVETPSEIEKLDPSITVAQVSPALRYGTCHSYALSKHLGLLGRVHTELSIIGCGDWYNKYNILEHFKKVTRPRPGDIIIYKNGPRDAHIKHTGIVCDDDFVESKWGIKEFICRHKTFHAPINYGNCVEYYRACKTNAEIIAILQQTIKNDVNLVNHRRKTAKDLIECASSKQGSECYYRNDYYPSHDVIQYLLEYNLCCSVDTRNNRGKTLLMLAARAGNYDIVEILLEYGADIELRDKYGNTALEIAQGTKYTAIINLLIAKQ